MAHYRDNTTMYDTICDLVVVGPYSQYHGLNLSYSAQSVNSTLLARFSVTEINLPLPPLD
jgi:hypothetical protein